MLSSRNLRSKRFAAPLAYAVIALLLLGVVVRFLSPQKQYQQPQQRQQQQQQQKDVKSPSKKLEEVVEEVRQQLQQQHSRPAGKQEVLQKVQQLLGDQQQQQQHVNEEIKDLEQPGHRGSGVSREQLLQLPQPEPQQLRQQLAAVKVLLKPRFPNCATGKQPMFLVLVHTRASEIAYRNAIRETWYSPLKSHTHFLRSRPHLWKVVFTTGTAVTGQNLQKEIEEEASSYGDILQFAFADSPHAATSKTIGAVLFLSQDLHFKRCPPKFVLKVTDDTFVNMPAFVHWLAAKFPVSSRSSSSLYIGHTVHADQPDRNSARRTSFISRSAYPFDLLPDYNKNPAYLLSWDLIGQMAEQVSLVQPISSDDAYVGILMARIGVKPQFNDHFVMLEGPMDVCMHLRMFFISHLPPIEVLNVFDRNSRGRHLAECRDVLPYSADKMDL